MKTHLIAAIALLVVFVSPTTADARSRDKTAPTVAVTSPAAGATVAGTVTVAATASDNRAVDHVTFRVDGTAVGSDSASPYKYAWNTTAYTNGSHDVSARAADTSGNVSTDSTVRVAVANGTPPPPPPNGRHYFATEPVGTAGLPRAESYCADNILLNKWEPTSHGNLQFNVPRDDVATNWGDSRFSWWSSFPGWLTKRAQVTGHFTDSDGSVPTTTELISFAACRWGVDEDLIRAVAVQESDWHQHFWGDRCGQTNDALGIGSYGIIQIKNFNCVNEGDWGGFRRTYESTPFALDFYGAAMRGCLDRNFWYGYGTTAPSDTAGMIRGCVGAWFSGDFSPSSSYTNSVYQHLANRDWLGYT